MRDASVDLGDFPAVYENSDPTLDGLPVRFRGRLSLVDWIPGERPDDVPPQGLVRQWRVEHLLAHSPNEWRERGDFVAVPDTSARGGADFGGHFLVICSLASSSTTVRSTITPILAWRRRMQLR